jgi:hypothetical protein
MRRGSPLTNRRMVLEALAGELMVDLTVEQPEHSPTV